MVRKKKLKDDILKAIREFTLMDDTFVSKVFEDDPENVEFMLRIFLDDDKIKVIKAEIQKRIKNLQGHDLQLDILAEKANGEKFNVEIQNESSGAIAQRARYHLSLLDANSLVKGKSFKDLPENYVIFVTKRDYLQGNLPIYHIHRTIDENGKQFNDGSHIIYVNNKIQDNTPLGRLMHDFSCKNPDDMYYENLAKKIKYFKEEEEGVQKMGDVMEKLIAKREKELGHVMEELMAKREREAMEKAEKEMVKREREAMEKAEKEMAKREREAMEKAEKEMAKREREAEKKTAKKERRELAKNLLAENETIERTARLTTLSVAEVRKLAEKLSA